MLLEQQDTAAALARAAQMDIDVVGARFRALLPDVPARETMAHETALEYRRLRALQELGSPEAPAAESLLSRFTALSPEAPSTDATGGPSYETLFGHEAPYVWNTPLEALLEGEPMPGGGGGADNCAM